RGWNYIPRWRRLPRGIRGRQEVASPGAFQLNRTEAHAELRIRCAVRSGLRREPEDGSACHRYPTDDKRNRRNGPRALGVAPLADAVGRGALTGTDVLGIVFLRHGDQPEDAPDGNSHHPHATRDDGADPLWAQGVARLRCLRQRKCLRRARWLRRRCWRRHIRSEGDGFTPVLVRLANDDLLGRRSLTCRLEKEGVLARIDRESAPLQSLGKDLPIHRHLDRTEVLARAILGLEDDGRDGGVDLINPMDALLSDVGGTVGGGADQELRALLPQLLVVARLE